MNDLQVPVVVWGGGTGGVAAAIQAARSGSQTLLLTPGDWAGGMVSAAGVCCPDGNELSPWQTGLWGAFLRALAKAEPEGLDHNWVSCFGYRPTTAEGILQRWMQQLTGLEWWPNCKLRALERRGSRITGIVVERGKQMVRVEPQVVIDGSDLGELLPLAEVTFRLGWEAREQWEEPSAPTLQQLKSDPFFSRQPVQSPTWVVMGQLGQGASTPENPSGFPADRNPGLPPPFEAACEQFGLNRTLSYGRLPGGLVMLNWPLHGNDWHGGLQRAFSTEDDAQLQLAAAMQAHSLAFAAALRDASAGWMQLGRAFPSRPDQGLGPLALMPYWREGRRMVGHRVVREQDLLPVGSHRAIGPLPKDDSDALTSIAVGNYANDHHYPGPDWPLATKSCRWGGRWSGTPFCIPYGALVSAEIDNLLAADKAISTTHMANGATRLQPLVLNVGQAAGAAAALAVQDNMSPRDLPIRKLQERLLHDPWAPSSVVPLWDTPWHHPRWRQRQLAVLQDPDLINGNGLWQGHDGDPCGPANPKPSAVAGDPHEQLWEGILHAEGEGCFALELGSDHAAGDLKLVAGSRWPVITLEPGLNHWLQQQDKATPARLIGCVNLWGPWLRMSRLG